MNMQKTEPVTLKVEIEPEGLKRVVEQGRLLEFVDAFSTLAAGEIKAQLVEQLAKAGVGLAEVGGGVNIAVGFLVDDPYGTRPRPWPWPGPGPWWNAVLVKEQLREMIREEVGQLGKR